LDTLHATFADQILGYYSVLFTHLQQKDISGFLTFLWQTDPFKAKWSILAKAYSVIRDHEGKEKAPLDGFLSINANFIGIIDPGSYLVMLGWQIAADGDGQIVLRREFEVNVNSLDVHLLTTNASVNDVVCNSYLHGYIVGGRPAVAPNGHGATLTMATSTQPFSRVAESASAESTKEDDFEDAEGPALNDGDLSELGLLSDEAELSDVVSDSGKDVQEEMEDAATSAGDGQTQLIHDNAQEPTLSHDEIITTTSFGLTPSAGSNNLSPTVLHWINKGLPDPAVDPPVSSLANTAYHLSGEYPFVSEFDPKMPSLHFDPFMGNRFNAFNMSDWINDEEL